ncbi:NAD(P)-dependent oxidoreductase [Thalassobacillus sp. CUG 92003]|uniref:NAD(P)-dependent oxidoreductase n=1 Tax=Thalassobacillus sp. CUG 92003 TaxID=2736641 RepID=UPI0015E7123B|nr:NAD(P)H-binding protein [Thalassobacillus sp. CUG 92003]
MRIAVFGGTGRVGQRFIELAREDGHEVIALVRDKQAIEEKYPDIELVEGDVKNRESVEKTMQNSDMVFSSLGTDKTDTLSTGVPVIIRAMENFHITRIVTIGTAGILDSRSETGKYRFETRESKRKSTFAAKEHLKAYKALQNSQLKWTIICPTYLPSGEEHGNVRHEEDFLPEQGEKITVGDTARFAYHELLYEQLIYHRVGICY